MSKRNIEKLVGIGLILLLVMCAGLLFLREDPMEVRPEVFGVIAQIIPLLLLTYIVERRTLHTQHDRAIRAVEKDLETVKSNPSKQVQYEERKLLLSELREKSLQVSKSTVLVVAATATLGEMVCLTALAVGSASTPLFVATLFPVVFLGFSVIQISIDNFDEN